MAVEIQNHPTGADTHRVSRALFDVVGGVVIGGLLTVAFSMAMGVAETGLSRLSWPAVGFGLALLTVGLCVLCFYAPRPMAVAGGITLLNGLIGLSLPVDAVAEEGLAGFLGFGSLPIALTILGAALLGAAAVKMLGDRSAGGGAAR